MIWSWYTGRWWVDCYICSPPSPHPPPKCNSPPPPPTASVPISVFLYNSPLLCGFNVLAQIEHLCVCWLILYFYVFFLSFFCFLLCTSCTISILINNNNQGLIRIVKVWMNQKPLSQVHSLYTCLMCRKKRNGRAVSEGDRTRNCYICWRKRRSRGRLTRTWLRVSLTDGMT